MTIEVHIDQTGDWAEVEGDAVEEAAISCAKTIAREAYDSLGGAFPITVTFRREALDDGSPGPILLASVPEKSLWTVA